MARKKRTRTIYVVSGRYCNKWISLILCVTLGVFGAHKFYEGKIGMGILYLCTLGLFFVGVVMDFFKILSRPTRYFS